MNQQDGDGPPLPEPVSSSSFVAVPSEHDPKKLTAELLRSALPDLQPQEGSPANTFTDSELQELQAALPGLNIRPRNDDDNSSTSKDLKKSNILDIREPWPPEQTCIEQPVSSCAGPQEAPSQRLDWHGAPQFVPHKVQLPREFRSRVRRGEFTGPTNGVCPGFLQCNLVVLPQGQHAFDFLLFCQRNSKACPLLEVCDTGSPVPVALAPHADLRTDVPK